MVGMLRWVACALGVLAQVLAFGGPSRAEAPGPRQDEAPQRIWADARMAWIYPEPRRAGHPVGYVRAGASLALRSPEPTRTRDCPGGYFAVAPLGYLCLDRHTSLAATRYSNSMGLTLPRGGALPYDYAFSDGTPMYWRVPNRSEWERREALFGPAGRPRGAFAGHGHEQLARSAPIEPEHAVPAFLIDGGSAFREKESRIERRKMPFGSMLAYGRSFPAAGRTWLLSSDGTVVPAERVRKFQPSEFHGVALGGAVRLPLAWVKRTAKPKYRRGSQGKFVRTGAVWAKQTFVTLDSAESMAGEYLKTTHRDGDTPLFIAASDAVVVDEREKLPWGIEPRDRWLFVSITRGVLVAYEGTRAVFTTLVSPGVGGVPLPGRDPVEFSTTPLGHYRMKFKHLTDDMSPEHGDQRSYWLADVPYAQYFDQPFAIHVSYWHDSFGEPMSAGCINVSPRDGKWLFDFTDPPLPAGWHGVQAGFGNPKGTWVVIVR